MTSLKDSDESLVGVGVAPKTVDAMAEVVGESMHSWLIARAVDEFIHRNGKRRVRLLARIEFAQSLKRRHPTSPRD